MATLRRRQARVCHWLNSLGFASALLVDSFDDLKDGVVLCDLATFLHNAYSPLQHQHQQLRSNFYEMQTDDSMRSLRVAESMLSHIMGINDVPSLIDTTSGRANYSAILNLLETARAQYCAFRAREASPPPPPPPLRTRTNEQHKHLGTKTVTIQSAVTKDRPHNSKQTTRRNNKQRPIFIKNKTRHETTARSPTQRVSISNNKSISTKEHRNPLENYTRRNASHANKVSPRGGHNVAPKLIAKPEWNASTLVREVETSKKRQRHHNQTSNSASPHNNSEIISHALPKDVLRGPNGRGVVAGSMWDPTFQDSRISTRTIRPEFDEIGDKRNRRGRALVLSPSMSLLPKSRTARGRSQTATRLIGNSTSTRSNTRRSHSMERNARAVSNATSGRPSVALLTDRLSKSLPIDCQNTFAWLCQLGFGHLIASGVAAISSGSSTQARNGSPKCGLPYGRSVGARISEVTQHEQAMEKVAQVFADGTLLCALVCLTGLGRETPHNGSDKIVKVGKLSRRCVLPCGATANPTTLAARLRNITVALDTLRARNPPVPGSLDWSARQVAQGHVDAIWGLLHGLCASVTHINICNNQSGAELKLNLSSPQHVPKHVNPITLNSKRGGHHHHHRNGRASSRQLGDRVVGRRTRSSDREASTLRSQRRRSHSRPAETTFHSRTVGDDHISDLALLFPQHQTSPTQYAQGRTAGSPISQHHRHMAATSKRGHGIESLKKHPLLLCYDSITDRNVYTNSTASGFGDQDNDELYEPDVDDARVLGALSRRANRDRVGPRVGMSGSDRLALAHGASGIRIPSADTAFGMRRRRDSKGSSSASGDQQYHWVNAEQEHQVRAWLHQLGFNILRAPQGARGGDECGSKSSTSTERAYVGYEDGPALADPFRNGCLLNNLLGVLEPAVRTRDAVLAGTYHPSPSSLRQARANVERAMCLLRTLASGDDVSNQVDVPPALLERPEPILKGQHQVIFGLLHALRMAYPSSVYSSANVVGANSSLAGGAARGTHNHLLLGQNEQHQQQQLGQNIKSGDRRSTLTKAAKMFDASTRTRISVKVGAIGTRKRNGTAIADTNIAAGAEGFIVSPISAMSSFSSAPEQHTQTTHLDPTRIAQTDLFPSGPVAPFPSSSNNHNRGARFGISNAGGNDALYSQTASLPYSTQQLALLERSLLSWLHSIGLLSVFRASTTANVPDSFDEPSIHEAVVNGLLLCEVAQLLAGHPLPGVFKDPKTTKTALSNLRLALSAMRNTVRMSAHFLTNDVDVRILSGDRVALLGLLEDAHRCFHGLAPRTLADLRAGTDRNGSIGVEPFYGDHDPTYGAAEPMGMWGDSNKDGYLSGGGGRGSKRSGLARQSANMMCDTGTVGLGSVSTTESSGFLVVDDIECKESWSVYGRGEGDTFNQNQNSDAGGDIFPSPFPFAYQDHVGSANGGDGSLDGGCKYRTLHANDIVPLCVGGVDEDDDEVPRKVMIESKTPSGFSFARRLSKDDNWLDTRPPDSAYFDTLSIGSHEPTPVEERSDGHTANDGGGGGSGGLLEAGEGADNRRQRRDSLGSIGGVGYVATPELVEWLDEWGVQLEHPETLELERTPDFSDGVHLCDLVNALEGDVGGIKGVERQPRSRAARLHNIRVALRKLENNHHMPPDFLMSEESIWHGNTAVIVPLLCQIRRSYRHRMR